MRILLTNVRIKNFRSLESIDVKLGITNVIIGQNNSGKSNFLKAIDLALGGNRLISEDDIFISANERILKDKTAIIDILLRPVNADYEYEYAFSDFWTSVFTEAWITTDETNGDFVGIRTTIQYDLHKNDYTIIRKPIIEWNSSIEETVVGKKKSLSIDMIDYLNSFYMDAHRDVSEDLRNKKSYFGRATSQTNLSDELVETIEKKLNDVNNEIVKNIPSLRQTADRMAAIGRTIGATTSSVEIEPLARKITDLHKGMDVIFCEGSTAKFSISQHGMGTRSWISFLTLGAYVDWYSENVKVEDADAESYVMLTMEEPEAHLHPQAQRQLYSQILSFSGQKIISTHSPSIVAQANIEDILCFGKRNGRTTAFNFDVSIYKNEEIKRIQREVINTRGELFFSSGVVLCEGITEEQALPKYFHEYFGTEPIFCGINIIGIGGQNYKTFLNLIKNFEIDWFIFSDGEKSTISTVKKAVKVITNSELAQLNNVVILENEEDYERHLLASGYGDVMIEAINQCEEDINYFNDFKINKAQTTSGRRRTNKPRCKTCDQEIYEDVFRDYNGMEGHIEAIYDCCTAKGAKAKYASLIANRISEMDDPIKRIPPKVRELFCEIAKTMSLEVSGDQHAN